MDSYCTSSNTAKERLRDRHLPCVCDRPSHGPVFVLVTLTDCQLREHATALLIAMNLHANLAPNISVYRGREIPATPLHSESAGGRFLQGPPRPVINFAAVCLHNICALEPTAPRQEPGITSRSSLLCNPSRYDFDYSSHKFG